MKKQPAKTLVPDEIYTDRQEFIDYFYNAAINAIERRTMSTVLLGQRRMGKTEIFKRVVNRLFFEQDCKNQKAVVPVYFQLPEQKRDELTFATSYVENFVRWYAAFKLNEPEFLTQPNNPHELIKVINKELNITKGFSFAVRLLNSLVSKKM